MCLKHIAWLLVERLKLFVGKPEDAFRLAMEDADQYDVRQILAWRGDPSTRTTMELMWNSRTRRWFGSRMIRI